MAIISSFLCWTNTRTGSAVSGYYTMIISVVCLAFYMLRYIALDEINNSLELKGIVYAGFVLYSCLVGVSLILLPGVYMDRKYLLLPWIYVLVITILYETGAVALITTVHLEQDHTLHVWEIVSVVFYCLRLIANCYCFACVVSQYQELSEGRGTFEYLFKPRQRHMGRGAPLPDSDEYNPPYGAALPPYSEENPYKEYSPPNYENIAVQYESLGTFAASARGERSRRQDRLGMDYPVSPLEITTSQHCLNYVKREAYNKSDDFCNESEINYSYSSFGGSLEEINDSSGSPGLLEISTYPDTSLNHHYPEYRNHQRCNSFDSDGAVAMTTSSARLMGSSDDHNSTHTSKKPARSKLPTSPLAIHKRTYITWI
ncbi:unnamed protein product [Candidula unifasciata]|uniref:Uncharacterized protein n=1 Tax=Candidula unifasciata TaxID=100452 RepID=A0A8S3Z934_9EUPU|nr:unnamed protein product [Candidula unifasciata]